MSTQAQIAIYVHLVADVNVTALLDNYLGSPAIFSASIPENAPNTYIYIPNAYQQDDDVKAKTVGNRLSRREYYQVTSVAKRSSSVVAVKAIADAVTRSLSYADLTPVGGTFFYGVACDFSTELDNQHDFVRQCETRILCKE